MTRVVTFAFSAAGVIDWSPDEDCSIVAWMPTATSASTRFIITTSNTRVTTDLSAPATNNVITDVLLFAGATGLSPVYVPGGIPIFAAVVYQVKTSILGSLLVWLQIPE